MSSDEEAFLLFHGFTVREVHDIENDARAKRLVSLCNGFTVREKNDIHKYSRTKMLLVLCNGLTVRHTYRGLTVREHNGILSFPSERGGSFWGARLHGARK